jgi:hypothetical protein
MIIGAILITGGVAIGGVTGWLIEKSMLAGLPDVATQNTLGPGENITRTIMAKLASRSLSSQELHHKVIQLQQLFMALMAKSCFSLRDRKQIQF